MNAHKNKITIIGSGLAGSFLAVLLARKGYKVEIYERLDKKEICDVASKRSYNLVLFGYGIEILKKAGLWDDIKPHLLALKGSVTHIDPQTKPVVSLIEPQKIPYSTITRAQLADILLKQATQHTNVTIHYNTQLLSVNRYEKSIVVKNCKTTKISTVPCEVLIGADGANSLVRPFLQQGQETNHSQEYPAWIYKQFILSSEAVEKLNLEKKFVHVWTHNKAFIIMHPDMKDAQYAILVFPQIENSEHSLNSLTEIESFFKKNFPELSSAIKEITESLISNPIGNFSTIHTDPWYYKDFMALIGDAAHGFYPFFGQGTSAAFGDCMLLVDLIDKYNANWGQLFPIYQQIRKPNADALGELSKEAMMKYLRNKKADFGAIFDKLEVEAYRHFPNIIYPPLSQTIVTDPEHAAYHRNRHLQQRKIAKTIGISLGVSLLTGLLTLYGKAKKSGK